MTAPRTRTRRAPRLVAVGIAVAFVAPLPAAAVTPGPSPAGSTSPPPASPPASPSDSASASPAVPSLPVNVVLGSLTPLAPQPGDVLRLTGTLHNDSDAPVSEISVQLRYRPTHIGSRSEFDDYATGSPTPDGSVGPLPLPPVVMTTAITRVGSRSLAPGAQTTFSAAVHVDDLSFDRPSSWQVYQLGVAVIGSTPTNGFITVGGLRTFLPWAPVGVAGVGAATQIAWVWPLVDRPHRTVANTWVDDDLAHAIGAGGRLAQLLAAGVAAEDQQPQAPPRRRKKAPKPKPTVAVTPVPVTWAIDPLLVDDVTTMSAGYKVGTGRKATPGPGADEAKAWLAALRTAVGKSETLALPYADPDIVAATRSGLPSEVQVAINSGATLLARELSTSTLPYVWPPAGAIDQRTLDTLFAARVPTVVLDGSALPPVEAPSVTPSAHATVRARDGNLDALLTDTGLDTVVDIGAREPGKAPLAVQRFLAETLMVQAEHPNDQRTLVVAPDHRWSPSATYATQLLTDSGKVPWISPVPLSAALTAPQQTDVIRQPLHYPSTARRAELGRGYLGEVRDLKTRVDTFVSILATQGDPHARTFDDALLRTLSSGWRGQRPLATKFLDDANTQLRTSMGKVRIASLPGSFVTLTSHSGTVPVTVSNELDTPVSVVVAISSQHLLVSGGGRAAQTIAPHRQIAVDVRAEARTSGVFELDVKLLTPTGHTYESEQLFVRSTAYGSVAILITAGATGALMLAVIVRLVRRALAARRPAATTS